MPSFQGRTNAVVLIGFLVLSAAAHEAYAGSADLLVSSTNTNEVLRYDGATGDFLDIFASGVNAPTGIVVGPDGNVYVASATDDNVLRYNRGGALIGEFVPPQSGGLDFAHGMTFGPDGDLYVAGFLNDEVMRYNGQTGAPVAGGVFASGSGLDGPTGIAFGPDGNLYVVSRISQQVLRYDGTSGVFIDVCVPTGSGGLGEAQGLTFGPDGGFYVAGTDAGRVLHYDGSCAFLGEFVSTGDPLVTPLGLVFGADGHLYVTDNVGNNVRRYNGQTGAPLGVFATGGGLTAPSYLTFLPGPTAAGEVPFDLLVERSGSDLTLSWSSSCLVSDDDFAIYEGPIGTFTDHIPIVCSTGGLTTLTFTPAATDSFYLVIPMAAGFIEGSYGQKTSGPRPASLLSCLPQSVGLCP